jgi:uroporphyrinogen-III decarboxylase
MYVGLATADPALMGFIRRYVEVKLEVARRTLQAADGGVDCLWLGEDLGTQRGPRVSPELFRRRVRPIHQRFVDLARARGPAVTIHSCGSSSWAFEDFIEMGIDMVDTLQPEAAEMEPAYLKETFGDRLAFHGCVSTAGPVERGTAEETADYCRRTLRVMMPGGGYCFAPTHQLQDDSPTENVLAMYRVAADCGRY